MIVRDDGDHWQVVMQSDHARLAGDIARAWGDTGAHPAPVRADSVIRACEHHDDGWLSWERMPVRDADGGPKTFFTVPANRQMDFYRGVIATLDDVDPYAALLTTMHACGLYGEDLGWTMNPLAPEFRQDGDRFVAEYAPQRSERIAAVDTTAAELNYDYNLLQVVDRISLHFCMRPDDGGQTIQRIVGVDGTEQPLTLAPVAPGVLSLAPFPFRGDEVECALTRRILLKQDFADDEALRRQLAETVPEPRWLHLQRGA